MESTSKIQTDDGGIVQACGICYEDYDIKNKRPHVLNCGHSLCSNCLKSIVSKQKENERTCPFDKKPLSNNILNYPVNWAFLEMLTLQQQKSKAKNSRKDNKSILNLSDGVYEGDVTNCNIREGKGIMKYKNGTVYEGEMQNNQRKGKGKFIYKNGDIYEGNWDNDLPNKHGIMTYKSGNIKSYNGNWKDGKFFGLGSMTYENDVSTEGIYCNHELIKTDIFRQTSKNSIVIGKYQNNNYNNSYKLIDGFEINNNGYISQGTFVQNSNLSLTKSDSFTVTNNSGTVFLLSYSNGMCNFHGEIKYSNGDEYKGDIVSMKKEGLGVLKIFKNETYQGGFKNDLFEGKGVYKYQDGGCYDGEWKQGQRHGIGKYTQKRYTYDGQWERNVKNGNGVEVMENGESYSGSFINNLKDGPGLYIFKNFDTYKGQWKEDKMHGEGAYVYKNGTEVTGNWFKGKLESGTDKNGKHCIMF